MLALAIMFDCVHISVYIPRHKCAQIGLPGARESDEERSLAAAL